MTEFCVKNLNAAWKEKSKENSQTLILKNISFSVKGGELVCLTGPNGSGKSTLLSIMDNVTPSNLYVDFTGTDMDADKATEDEKQILECKNGIFLDEINIKSFSRRKLAVKVAWLTQKETFTWSYSVMDTVLSARFCHTGSSTYTLTDYCKAEEALKRVQMEAFKERSVKELSWGELQKVRIARAICQEPDVFLLDEPVANLDFGYQEELLELLVELCHKENKAIIISIHDINLAVRYADRLLVLAKLNNERSLDKQLTIGKPIDIIKPEVLNTVYNQDFKTFIHPVYKCPQVCI